MKKMKKMKKIVLSLFLVLLLVASCLYYFVLPIVMGKAWSIKQELMLDSKISKKVAIKNNLLLNDFRLVEEYPATIKDSANTLIFVGHIYPRNEFLFPSEKEPQGRDHPLLYLTDIVNKSPPARVIFGGDSVYKPTDEALEHLKDLNRNMSKTESRFVIGNHDQYWKVLLKKPILFDAIYKKRYWYEDVNGVRLIYLHTINKESSYDLDEEQLTFLAKVLDPSLYRYSLIFQHHALWAGDSIHANTRYPNADKQKAIWKNKIIPLLKRGNVQAVFAGDGGWRAEGRVMKIDEIPHYLTGWTYLLHIPSEWITLKLEETSPKISWHKFFEGDHYIRKDELYNYQR